MPTAVAPLVLPPPAQAYAPPKTIDTPGVYSGLSVAGFIVKATSGTLVLDINAAVTKATS